MKRNSSFMPLCASLCFQITWIQWLCGRLWCMAKLTSASFRPSCDWRTDGTGRSHASLKAARNNWVMWVSSGQFCSDDCFHNVKTANFICSFFRNICPFPPSIKLSQVCPTNERHKICQRKGEMLQFPTRGFYAQSLGRDSSLKPEIVSW